jgi:hypothetical protein
MRFDLKQPCKNCPFGIAETRIKFACRERAVEIEESAYRHGFPCHLSAEHIDDEDHPFGAGGYVFGEATQHCAGAAGLFINCEHPSWPGIDNDEELAERIALQMGPEGLAMCFADEEAFYAANAARSWKGKK